MSKNTNYFKITFIVTLLFLSLISCNNAPTTFTITYNANGGTGAVPTQEIVTEKQIVTIQDKTATLKKEALIFSGWNTKEDGTGTTYLANSTYTATANLTLYARWLTSKVLTKEEIKKTGFTQSGEFIWGDEIYTSIDEYAFEDYAQNLVSIVLPNTITSIGAWAFSDCPKVTSIILPSSVTSIKNVLFPVVMR